MTFSLGFLEPLMGEGEEGQGEGQLCLVEESGAVFGCQAQVGAGALSFVD